MALDGSFLAGARQYNSWHWGRHLLQAAQAGAEKQLARTGASLAASIAAVAGLERDLAAAGDKYALLQDMRAYLADLCDMLQARRRASFAHKTWPLWSVHWRTNPPGYAVQECDC